VTRRPAAWLLRVAALAVSWGVLMAAAAEPIRVDVTVDRTRATVGDPILVKVSVTHPPGVTVTPPSPVAAEGPGLVLEAIARERPEPRDGKLPVRPTREVFFFRGQAFETGKVLVPAFRVTWSRPGGGSESVASKPIPVEIASVLKAGESEPSDLKPPAALPPPPLPWWGIAAAGLLALLLVGGILWWLRRRRARVEGTAVPQGPVLPAHELAYRELERLLASGLLREGKLKEFHVELAEIAKRYLAGRFGIETLERTTDEVLENLRRVRVGSSPLGAVRDLLGETDLVKFAKHRPVGDEIRETVELVYRLVDLTKPVPPPPAPAAGEAPPGLSPERAG